MWNKRMYFFYINVIEENLRYFVLIPVFLKAFVLNSENRLSCRKFTRCMNENAKKTKIQLNLTISGGSSRKSDKIRNLIPHIKKKAFNFYYFTRETVMTFKWQFTSRNETPKTYYLERCQNQ